MDANEDHVVAGRILVRIIDPIIPGGPDLYIYQDDFNTLEPGVAFSDIVAQAKEAGYTEPDPRDDLSGMDVARKVTILARECGLELELSDVPIQSLVPEPLRDVESVDEFMKELPKYDGDILKQQEAAAAAGEVLCFVGAVDVEAGTGSVELRRYPADHPFAQLKGER